MSESKTILSQIHLHTCMFILLWTFFAECIIHRQTTTITIGEKRICFVYCRHFRHTNVCTMYLHFVKMIKVKDRFRQQNIRHHRQKQKKHTKFLSHDVIVKGLNMKQKVREGNWWLAITVIPRLMRSMWQLNDRIRWNSHSEKLKKHFFCNSFWPHYASLSCTFEAFL